MASRAHVTPRSEHVSTSRSAKSASAAFNTCSALSAFKQFDLLGSTDHVDQRKTLLASQHDEHPAQLAGGCRADGRGVPQRRWRIRSRPTAESGLIMRLAPCRKRNLFIRGMHSPARATVYSAHVPSWPRRAAQATRRPTSQLAIHPPPLATTFPAPSKPGITGNCRVSVPRPCMKTRSDGLQGAASIFTSTSPGCGVGTATSLSSKRLMASVWSPPCSVSSRARIVVGRWLMVSFRSGNWGRGGDCMGNCQCR